MITKMMERTKKRNIINQEADQNQGKRRVKKAESMAVNLEVDLQKKIKNIAREVLRKKGSTKDLLKEEMIVKVLKIFQKLLMKRDSPQWKESNRKKKNLKNKLKS